MAAGGSAPELFTSLIGTFSVPHQKQMQAAGQGIAKSRLVGNLVGQDAAAITQAQEQVR
jgi:hypothetical protein